MKYYVLSSKSAPGDPIAQEIAIPQSYDHFYLGQPLPRLKKPIRIALSKSKHGLPDLIQGPYVYLIASDRLRQVFEDLDGSNVELAPVELRREGQTVATYAFVQVLNNIDAIDWSKSNLESYPEDKYSVVSVRKLVLDPQAIGGRHVLRLMGLTTDLIVSDAFLRRVLDAGMTGMQFTPVEDFRIS